jgi:hypothetical protein
LTRLLAYSGAFGSGLSVMSNTASQLADNGGNWAAVNMGEQGLAGSLGFGFGIGSGLFTSVSTLIEQSAAGLVTALNSEGANAEAWLVGQGAPSAIVNNVTGSIINGIGQTESLADLETGLIFGLDTFGSPLAESLTEQQLESYFGLDSQNGNTPGVKPCPGESF